MLNFDYKLIYFLEKKKYAQSKLLCVKCQKFFYKKFYEKQIQKI